MREDLCTIPINEVFEPKDGCPFCRMRDMLEDRMATYITGAAMMEPNVRIETNRLGFCNDHFNMILGRGHRLSVALILESLLHDIEEELYTEEKKLPVKKALANGERRGKSCFMCENIDKNMYHMFSTVFKVWETEEDFRKLYGDQTHICLPHYRMVLTSAQKGMARKHFPAFAEETRRLSQNYIKLVSKDVTHFCRMHDYRNQGQDWGTSRDSIERAIQFLTSREPTTVGKASEKNR
jgi:hypothetical protein